MDISAKVTTEGEYMKSYAIYQMVSFEWPGMTPIPCLNVPVFQKKIYQKQ